MLPNFLIIGAPKAGTTSLYHYLMQHPAVFMCSPKEPHFFAFEGSLPQYRGPRDQEIFEGMVVTRLVDYQRLFEAGGAASARGEASALYLYFPDAIGRIQSHLVDPKLVVILRDPAQRAYSSFLHLRRDGRETEADFGRALEAEVERIRQGWAPLWHYRTLGFYARPLKAYLDAFGADRLKVCLFDDLLRDPGGLVRSLFDFLGVDRDIELDLSFVHNRSGLPRSARLHGLLKTRNRFKDLLKPLLPERWRRRLMLRIIDLNLAKPEPPARSIRQRLVDEYHDDVVQLSRIIRRDLGAWLQP